MRRFALRTGVRRPHHPGATPRAPGHRPAEADAAAAAADAEQEHAA
ncbi:hypothetical protein OG432_14130 [Streptomyces sp. NBC_00442]